MRKVAQIGAASAAWAQRVIPDPFVIAILLAGLVLIVGSAASDSSALQLAEAFTTGLFAPGLLAFGFKMALILVTGHALAEAPAVKSGLLALAARPTDTAGAAGLVAAFSMIAGLFNWGLGLVAGAFLARAVGEAFRRAERPLNYPLVGAAGYLGLLVWHGGLSGSAPLKVAKNGPFGPAISVSDTLLSGQNLACALSLVVVLTLLFRGLGHKDETHARDDVAPTRHHPALAPKSEPSDDAAQAAEPGTLARLESSVLITAMLALPILTVLGRSAVRDGFAAIHLDSVILVFWATGLILHKSPVRYAAAFAAGAKGSAGILLQFPLYFGILAAANTSGLLADFARGLGALTDIIPLPADVTAPGLTFISAAGINMLVPSGGGQWVLQAPIIADACARFSLERAEMVLAFSYGDELTNMLQPFWALPLLSITGLKAREVMGYTMLAMVVATPIFLFWLTAL